MKILIGTMSHETNTYAPAPGPFARFEARRALIREDACFKYYKNRDSMTAVLAEVREYNIELTTTSAGAMNSGKEGTQ